MSKFSFDTNILIYSIDLRFPEKHAIAKKLVRRCGESDGIVALQCLNEFYRAATRKHILSTALAFDVVQETRAAFSVVPPTEEDLFRAMQYHKLHKMQFFDTLLWATIAREGCTTFFSEDYQDGRILSNVKFQNPFAPGFNIDDLFS